MNLAINFVMNFKKAAQTLVFFGVLVLFLNGCSSGKKTTEVKSESNPPTSKRALKDSLLQKMATVSDTMELALITLHDPPPAPGWHDWLKRHKEPGQTFEEYLAADPTGLTEDRFQISIILYGSFSEKEREVMELCTEYLQLFYTADVKVIAEEKLTVPSIPMKYKRVKDSTVQVKTYYFLYEKLQKNLPDSSALAVGFTTYDLYPSEKWNYVFGQASLKNRVGVWSVHRFGDPEESEEAFKLFLMRTLKTAAHEIGHAFTIKHCIFYSCCMAGSNNLAETDRHPSWFCPVCAAKLGHNLGFDHIKRFRALQAFWEREGFREEAEHYRKSAELLEKEEAFRK